MKIFSYRSLYNESNGLWYELIGDYYIPVLTLTSKFAVNGLFFKFK